MGYLEDFAAALAGDQAQQQIAAENPYYGLQAAPNTFLNTAMTLAAQNPTQYSNKEKYGSALIGGLLSGMLGGAGDNYQATLTDRYNNALMGSMTGRPVTDEGLSPNLFKKATTQGSLFGIRRNQGLADMEAELRLRAKIENEDMGKKAFMQALAKAQDGEQASQILQMGKELGIFPAGATIPKTEAVAAPQEAASITDMGPDLGIPSYDEVYKERLQEYRKAGATPSKAAEQAGRDVQDLRSRSKSLIGSKLAEQSESIGKVEDIVRKGEEGIAKAGMTGSKIASLWEKTLSLAPGVFPEAAQQAAGDSLLNQTQNLGAMINRIVGSGAMSDMESRALFETAMQPSKTKPQNEAVLKQYQNGLAIMKEHSDFMNYVMSKANAEPEIAQQLWELYKREEPILVKDKQGGYGINGNRTPWQKFDFQGAYAKFMSGEGPRAGASGSWGDDSGAPAIGGTFNGQKVKSVRKVK